MIGEALFVPVMNTALSSTAGFCAAGLAALFATALGLATRGQDRRRYRASHAWLRAGMYFAICWTVSAASGVLPALMSTPVLNPDHVNRGLWQAQLLLSSAIIAFGYLYIWPRGTVTYARKLYLLPTLLFGLTWGLSEGQLILAFWALAERTGAPIWLVAIIVYVLASASNALLHLFWWDRYVSPDHNIYEWNMKKVALAHNPLLILSLLLLVFWGDIWICLAWTTFALSSCAIAQKFPAPWDNLAHGELEAQLGLRKLITMSVPAAKRRN